MSGGETGARIETYLMSVTSPTFHCERSEENDVAPVNMLLWAWSERQRAPGVRGCGERRRDGRAHRDAYPMSVTWLTPHFERSEENDVAP